MDFTAIIKEHIPDGVELGDKAIAAMVKAIKSEVGKNTVTNEQYSIKTKSVTELEAQVMEMQAKLADHDAVKQSLEDEKAAHAATKKTHDDEKDAHYIDGLVSDALKAAGMNEKIIPKALKQYDRSLVKRDKDGSISNAEKIVETFKDEWGDFFGETQIVGADVGSSSQSTPAKTYTLDDISKMSPAQINENWASISKSLNGGNN